MEINTIGLDLIKRFEGCRLVAYKCLNTEKYYTIGYGHYGADVKKGMVITQKQANEFLKNDVKVFEDTVNNAVKVSLTQSMFNALVSFTYNVGGTNFRNSTLLKKLNEGDYEGASNEFPKWKKSGGKVLQGLVTRRAVERTEFLRETFPVARKSTYPNLHGYKGFSIVDGLKNHGYDSSFDARAEYWRAIGKTSKYKGTASQNTTLLNYLKYH